jgi:hypothetical protein
LLVELKLRGDFANVLDAFPPLRPGASRHAAPLPSAARRAVAAWLQQPNGYPNGSNSSGGSDGSPNGSRRGGGGGGGDGDGDDDDGDGDLGAWPGDLAWQLVSKCGSAAAVGALLQGLKVSASGRLLLECHRRGAAGPVLDYLAETMPGCVGRGAVCGWG